jgi:16S rRNA U516 pseudouridylate synthase RsuA-like enzyme
VTLRRLSIGGLALDDLASGAWRVLDADDLAQLWRTPRP